MVTGEQLAGMSIAEIYSMCGCRYHCKECRMPVEDPSERNIVQGSSGVEYLCKDCYDAAIGGLVEESPPGIPRTHLHGCCDID